MKYLRYGVLLSIAGSTCCQAMDYSLASECDIVPDRVATLSLGAGFPSTAKSQTIYLEPDLAKTYTENHQKNNAFFNADLFLGFQDQLDSEWTGQWGLDIVVTSNTKRGGDIWEDADPDFNNYTYTYQMNHASVGLKGVLLAAQPSWFVQPYINGSIGVGFNRSRGFTSTPKIFEEVIEPGFNNHTTTSFTYTLGVGVQKPISCHFSAGIGYEFSDWGSAHLNPANGQTINQGISYSHLYNNAVMLNLSYANEGDY